MALLLAGFLAIAPALADHPKHEIDALNDRWVAADIFNNNGSE